MNRNMIGEKIYRLRRKAGLSQAELGDMVGVSNKAVSKWETQEANPDISLLPALAKALGVSTDELLAIVEDESKDKNERSEDEPEKSKCLGFEGSLINNKDRYEFVSDKRTKKGTPILHINIGKRLSTINSKARGVVAIGNNAKGILSLGLISTGVFSLGVVSIGLLAVGIFCIGLLLAFGTAVIGGVAVGAIAVGVVAIGSVAIGFVSVGAVAIGYYAHTGEKGMAIGRRIFIHKLMNWKK